MADDRQKRIQSFAFVISAFTAFCFAFYFTPNLIKINSSPSDVVLQVANQINPNTAEIDSLIRLPDIGFSRAEAIIEYRNNFVKNNNRAAFGHPDDLQKIAGIGPKTIYNVKELLEYK
ncbi:MAG: helix-hairpin-helix domain-containing protein [Sedimentisphaerales bacterium]|nr:helix-hairpin-helix domain-containing protein [Sedimentisphaerales bacterium]